MPMLERRISLRGPRFWREAGRLMFARQIDASTRDGPRPATETDRAAFPDALAAAAVASRDPPGAPMIAARDPTPGPEPQGGRRR